MENPKLKHVLLCVAGLTPQIILETLYVLTQERGEPVDEVRVITTAGGRDRIKQILLDPARGKFHAFCREFRIDPAAVKFDETTVSLLSAPDGRALTDIRTVEENEYAGDQICEIVREMTRDPDTRIHASAAGGRKTMSIYLTAAMQLYGRAHDSLSHVLVGEDFEGHPDFFYPPPEPRTLRTSDGREVSTASASLHLAPIPFIRLRGARSDWLQVESSRSYVEVVRHAQENLDFIEQQYDLYIDPAGSRLLVGKGRSVVRLTPRELLFYAMFAAFRLEGRGGDGTVSLDRLTRADFDESFRRITRARGDEVGLEECSSSPGFDFLGEMLAQIESRWDRDRQDFKDKFYTLNSRIKAKLGDKGLPAQYTLVSREDRGPACYQLPLAPERIHFK